MVGWGQNSGRARPVEWIFVHFSQKNSKKFLKIAQNA
jgi:hypothetical protein